MFEWLVLLSVGVGAGTLGGVIGFGSTVLLMPPLVWFYGPLQTVPIIAVTAGMANLSRAAVWWREIEWRVCLAYTLGAVPAVVLGARTLVAIPQRPAEVVLGAFLIAMIPLRRWLKRRRWRVPTLMMLPVGAVIGYLTGIVATTGAINTPFFLAHGLVKGAFLGTEALSSLGMYVAKGIAFQQLGVLTAPVLQKGLSIGLAVTLGSWLSKRLVLVLPEAAFLRLMEGVMLVSGGTLLAMAAQAAN